MHCDGARDLPRGAVLFARGHGGQTAAAASEPKARDEGGEETEKVPIPLSGNTIVIYPPAPTFHFKLLFPRTP